MRYYIPCESSSSCKSELLPESLPRLSLTSKYHSGIEITPRKKNLDENNDVLHNSLRCLI